MPVLVAQEEMKKKQEPKKEFFLYEMNLVNGIQSCKDLNYGISIMEEFIKEKM